MDQTPGFLAQDPVMALAQRRLGWLESRQRVLAQNIANADTPNYTPSDVTPFARVLERTAGMGLARTDGAHLAPTVGGNGVRRDRVLRERTPDGNAVALDDQAMKVAETDAAHQLALNLYRRYQALYRTALGRAG